MGSVQEGDQAASCQKPEVHNGARDVKVAGSGIGITALKMKIKPIPRPGWLLVDNKLRKTFLPIGTAYVPTWPASSKLQQVTAPSALASSPYSRQCTRSPSCRSRLAVNGKELG
jgi:hypothetical protein